MAYNISFKDNGWIGARIMIPDDVGNPRVEAEILGFTIITTNDDGMGAQFLARVELANVITGTCFSQSIEEVQKGLDEDNYFERVV